MAFNTKKEHNVNIMRFKIKPFLGVKKKTKSLTGVRGQSNSVSHVYCMLIHHLSLSWVLGLSSFFPWNSWCTKEKTYILLEPVIIMSPAEMTVGPNHSQIKFGPLWISKNGPNWQYRNVFNLGTVWTNRHLCRTHYYNWLYTLYCLLTVG